MNWLHKNLLIIIIELYQELRKLVLSAITTRMNAEEYKSLINEKDVLDHTTLNVTLKELASRQELKLTKEIKRILESNQIAKPELHAKPHDTSTTYYKIDLASDDVEKIIYIFLDLEASYVGVDGETTPTASFYASLVDTWNKLT